jgi:hypothetical protein
MTAHVIDRLLNSDEPSIRFKILANVLGEDPESPGITKLREEIRTSPRAALLLSERDKDSKIPFHPYSKWYGAHWVLASLADIGYPPGDESLIPLREQVYKWLFGKSHQKRIRTIEGRVRRCASQEGNALYYLLTLGLADERTDELAARLCTWQWPDGGWNCDKNPRAVNSSFMESLIPLRALALHARLTGNRQSKEAAERAAKVFLKRRLYKRQTDGSIINVDFVRLHYPCYWHYDILFGLVVMTEAGFVGDERCHDALGLLESKRLPDSGFPAEKKYYQATGKPKTGRSLVDWGGTSKRRMNEFVTTEALCVLKESGRLRGPRNDHVKGSKANGDPSVIAIIDVQRG